MKLCFVILHYGAIHETKKSVSSIVENIDIADYKIIIVDNCSPDRSWDELQALYGSNDNIVLIHNEENLGFARGNNTGFIYAKNKYQPEYIVLMNNDVYLIQKDFYKNIDRLYKTVGFSVLGPMIISGDGKVTTNPIRKHLLDSKAAIKGLKRYQRLLRLNRLGLDGVYKRVMSRIHPYHPQNSVDERISNQVNVGLHGSFLVFSRDYIKAFDGLNDRTFLYFEEDLLLLRILSNHMTSLYTPEIVVFHREDAATKELNKTSRKKDAFVYSNCIKSLNIYIDELRQAEGIR